MPTDGRVITRLLRRLVPLQDRNRVRLALALHPFEYRSRWPELATIPLRRNDIVLDVGANVGSFTECVIAYQPWAIVHAFEPIPRNFQILRRKFSLYSNVHCRNEAVGREEGSEILNISRYDEASSFLELGEPLERGVFGKDYAVESKIRVPIIPLAKYVLEQGIERVRLLKLDVQGWELEALKGARGALPIIEYVYTEAQFQELYKGGPLFHEVFLYLHSRGFDLLRMVEFRVDERGQLLECDMLFKNRMWN